MYNIYLVRGVFMKVDEETFERLYKEYQLCSEHAYKLESFIWQTASLLGIGSLAGFGLLMNKNFNSNTEFFFSVLSASIFAISVSFIWIRFTMRWGSLEGRKFLHLQNIEDKIGFLQNIIITDYDKKAKQYWLRKRNCVDSFKIKCFRNFNSEIEPMDENEYKCLSDINKEKIEKYEYRSIMSMAILLGHANIFLWVTFTFYAALKPMILELSKSHLTSPYCRSVLAFVLVIVIYLICFLIGAKRYWSRP